MENKIVEIIKKYCNVTGEILPDSNLLIDLEMSSLELLSLISELEAEFQIKIKSKMLKNVESVEDIIKLVQELSEAQGE